MRLAFLGGAVLSLMGLPALACTADKMATTESGFVMKVVAGSNQIAAYTDATGATEAFKLELMEPYFVICQEGDYYRVTNVNAMTVAEAEAGSTGFVRRDQSFLWPTREALSFGATAFIAGRPEIVAWDDPNVLKTFMETGNARANPPAFRENIDATLKRERATRPYPVLSSDMKALMGAPKRVYSVLVPTAIRPTDDVVIEDPKDVAAVQAVLGSASIVVAFDATGSMAPFARETVAALSRALSTLPKDVRDGSQMGFVFYRDIEDKENLIEIPLMKIEEAIKVLQEASTEAYMTGGGDAPEPVLDALYYAANIFNWGQAGKRILVGVLNDDAKPATIGNLPDAKDRIPAGMSSMEVARDLVSKGIPVITVQAGPKAGPNLADVLGTIGEETRGRFLQWGAAGVTERDVAEALTTAMAGAAAAAITEGKTIAASIGYDANGFPTIPLEVMDGEKLERLRAAGINFNINRADGGVLVQEAYMLENTDLLEPQISIEKETLEKLINLYSVLSTTGVDGDALRTSVREAISAIAGEEFDPNAPLQEVVQKQLGIQFRSDLLNFNIEYLDALTPAERNALAKRIQDAAGSLTQFLDANLVEFDKQPTVWMSVLRLP